MSQFKILIVEDDLMISEMLREMLTDLSYEVVAHKRNFLDTVEFLEENRVDLAILDINLGEEKDGIDLGAEVGDSFGLPFIYLTSYSDTGTILRAGKTNPEAYIIKPFTQEELFATIEITKNRRKPSANSIMVKDGKTDARIEVKDIVVIKSDNNYLEVITNDRKLITRNSLENFLMELPKNRFMRIHRSYAINIDRIETITGGRVIAGGFEFPVSRARKEELMDLLKTNQNTSH